MSEIDARKKDKGDPRCLISTVSVKENSVVMVKHDFRIMSN
jgi:hypothetical protein